MTCYVDTLYLSLIYRSKANLKLLQCTHCITFIVSNNVYVGVHNIIIIIINNNNK